MLIFNNVILSDEPVKVVIVSTGSAAWPVIVPVSGDESDHLMEFGHYALRKRSYKPRKSLSYDEDPKAFRVTKDGKAMLAFAEWVAAQINARIEVAGAATEDDVVFSDQTHARVRKQSAGRRFRW